MQLNAGARVNWQSIRDDFGVGESCAHDHVRFLKEFLGPRLVRESSGRHVAYRLRDPAAPSESDITRAASVKFGEIALDVLKGTKYHREARQLAGQARGRVVLDVVDDLDRLVRGLYRRVQGVSDYHAAKVSALEVWLDAIRLRRRIRMVYQRANGAVDTYVVEPLVLILYQDRLHLMSIHAEKRRHRTFNLDGVQSAELLGERFLPPESFDVAEVYAHSFGIWSDIEPSEVVLLLRGTARIRAEQRPFHHSQVAGADVGEGWREFRYNVAVCPEFRSFLVGLLPDVRVQAPDRLVEYVLGVLREGLAAHPQAGS
ncbi:MAG: helix-turn-helix transcriptional regulator [Myxococcota bacterium]